MVSTVSGAPTLKYSQNPISTFCALAPLHHDQIGDRANQGKISCEGRCHCDSEPGLLLGLQLRDERLQYEH